MTNNVTADAAILPWDFDKCLASFLAELVGIGYKRGTLSAYKYLGRNLKYAVAARGLEVSSLTEELAAELVYELERTPREPNKYKNMAKRFVRHLMDLGVVARPVLSPRAIRLSKLQTEYEEYLRLQRGLHERSIYGSWRFVDRFITHRFGGDDFDLSDLKSRDPTDFLEYVIGPKSTFRDKTAPSHIRMFLQYLFRMAVTSTNLALCVPRVVTNRGKRLPRDMAPNDIELVLKAVRAQPCHGRRDYAMVLLMARLGLRAHEVVTIQLDDIDWRLGELLIRGKGGRHDKLPLPFDVGEALADYIKADRVSTTRALFVTARAPYRQLPNGQYLSAILREAFTTTGVKPPGPYVGSHMLRHSLATNLVRKGASLQEIGDMLRHRSASSTMIYARLDVDGLRSIAQEWPTTGTLMNASTQTGGSI
jgi:integrase/recombinase XerD